ncbi:MAG: DUF4389 domain-containing protein [Chloroflexi bacterium]|nr:DUF4389 domain-containing protein [Chloroflexota bacterium]
MQQPNMQYQQPNLPYQQPYMQQPPYPPQAGMQFFVQHQPNYSRLELLARVLFGWLYIGIPHGIALMIMSLISGLVQFIAFFAVLFMGRYPDGLFNFQLGYMAWQMRVQAAYWNLVDGYPEFGLEPAGQKVSLLMANPQSLSRIMLLVRAFFGWLYIGIPHGIALFFRYIISAFLVFIAFWIVLVTGDYPKGMHDFNVGTLRWATRVQLYTNFMTDEYPPFSGE